LSVKGVVIKVLLAFLSSEPG